MRDFNIDLMPKADIVKAATQNMTSLTIDATNSFMSKLNITEDNAGGDDGLKIGSVDAAGDAGAGLQRDHCRNEPDQDLCGRNADGRSADALYQQRDERRTDGFGYNEVTEEIR